MPQISFNTSNNTVPLKQPVFSSRSPNLYTTTTNAPTITTNIEKNIAYNPTIYNATRPSAINTAVQNVTLASAAGRLSGSNAYTTAHPASTNVRFGYGGATGGSYTTSTYGANNRATFTSAVPVTTTAVHTTPTVISTALPVTTSTYVAPAPVSTSYTQQGRQMNNTVYAPTQQIVQEVRNPVTVSQVQRVETTPVRHTEQYDQYDRNTYERNSQNVKVQERRQVVADAPKKQTNCCGPVCWALLGLLALAGLILGLLFGLGVIGGKGAGASTDAATNGTNTNGGSTTINGSTTTNGTSTNGTFTSGGISTNTQYAFPPASGASSVTVDTTVIYDQDGQPNTATSGSSGTTSNSTTTTTTSTTTTPMTTTGTTSTTGTTGTTSTSGSSTSTTTTSTSGTATLPTASLPVNRHNLRVYKHMKSNY